MLNTHCKRLNSIQCTPCMDQLTVNRAAAITFDMTIDLPCVRELFLGLLPCISCSNLRSRIPMIRNTCAQVSGNHGNVCIGRGWLLKRFAHGAHSTNTSHSKPPLFQTNSYYSYSSVTILFGRIMNTLFGLLFGPNRIFGTAPVNLQFRC